MSLCFWIIEWLAFLQTRDRKLNFIYFDLSHHINVSFAHERSSLRGSNTSKYFSIKVIVPFQQSHKVSFFESLNAHSDSFSFKCKFIKQFRCFYNKIFVWKINLFSFLKPKLKSLIFHVFIDRLFQNFWSLLISYSLCNNLMCFFNEGRCVRNFECFIQLVV